MESNVEKLAAAGGAKAPAISEDAREKLEHLIEEEEGTFNRLDGRVGTAIGALAIGVSLFHLFAAYDIVPAHVLRPAHVGLVLTLCFLMMPMLPRPHPVVGLAAGRVQRRDDRLRPVAGRLFRRPRHHAHAG